MSFQLQIPEAIYQAMIAHARAALPNECVGLLAGLPDGRVMERYPLVNALANPRRFESDAESMFVAEKQRRQSGLEFLAIYHSHLTSAAIPSRTDLELNYSEDVMNVIISLESAHPEVKAYWLTTQTFREAEWVVVAK